MPDWQPYDRANPRELYMIPESTHGAAHDYYGGPPPEPPSQLFEYWETIRRRLGWLCLIAVLGGLGGALVTLHQPSLYRSRTVLDIRNLNENVLSMRDGAGSSNTGNVLPETYLQTEIKILQSESILKRALERMQKQQKQPPPAAVEDSSHWWESLIKLDRQIPMNELLADASHRIKIRNLGNTRIVELLCDAQDAQIAANICNNLAQTYIEFNLESRYQSSHETGQWLSSQLNDVRQRLTKSESELKDSAKESQLLFNSEVENPAQEKLRQLQAEVSRAQAERISKQSEFEVVQASAADSLPMSLDAGPIREYRMRLTEFRRQLAEMSATMTPAHYKVRELKSQVAELENALQKERKDLLNRLQTDYSSAQRRETMLISAYDRQAAMVSQHGDRAVQYNAQARR
jgi:succinoglycan biosynthesis transport protein ExoP